MLFSKVGIYWVLGTGTWGILELNLNWVIGCLQKLDPCLYKGFQYIVLIEVDHCPNMHASYLSLVLWVLETEIHNTVMQRLILFWIPVNCGSCGLCFFYVLEAEIYKTLLLCRN